MPIDVGQIVAKKYELVRLLGRGSMGEVWSAHHQALREQVAIKLLRWPSGTDAEDPSVALERFRFEAQVAARLSRKTRHIARVTDYGEDDGLPYLVMELLDGESLEAAIRTRGPLAPAETNEIVAQMGRALVQAHAEGVAHRDLKPANVFLTRDEEGRLLVKLLDFGIARTIHAHRLQGTFTTAKGFVFGTPGYMSPEQTRASPKLDHRCDLWALATIAYEMLTGDLPVEGTDAEEVMKNVCAGRIVPLQSRDPRMPAALGAFFDRAFADRVDDRFEGAASFAQAFDLACGGQSGATTAPSSPSLSDVTGSTATEFSATVAGDALRMYSRQPRKVVLASAGALVTLVLAVMGLRAALHGPGAAPPDTVGAAAPDTVGAAAHADAVVRTVVTSLPAQPANAPATAPAAVAPSAAVPRATPAASAAVPPAAVAPEKAAAGPAAQRAPVDRSGPALAPAQVRAKPVVEAPAPRPAHAAPKPAEDRNDVF